MLHKTIKAAATATDQGQFSAIVAAYSVDRANEQIQPGAFEDTISKWQGSQKMIPLHWDHEASPESIIGTVDPGSMRESEEGLYVKGQLDLEGSETAREAWRLMKANSVAFSFGYLVGSEEKNADGVLELKDIDLFEVSVTPAPMNPDTRILALKSATKLDDALEDAAVKEREMLEDAKQIQAYIDAHPDFKIPEGFRVVDTKSLPSTEVETVESDEPETAKPAAKDLLKNQIDRELIDIALGR